MHTHRDHIDIRPYLWPTETELLRLRGVCQTEGAGNFMSTAPRFPLDQNLGHSTGPTQVLPDVLRSLDSTLKGGNSEGEVKTELLPLLTPRSPGDTKWLQLQVSGSSGGPAKTPESNRVQFQLEVEPEPLEKPPPGLCSVPAARMWGSLGPRQFLFMEQTQEPDPLPWTPVVFLQLQCKLTTRVPSAEPDLRRWVMRVSSRAKAWDGEWVEKRPHSYSALTTDGWEDCLARVSRRACVHLAGLKSRSWFCQMPT